MIRRRSSSAICCGFSRRGGGRPPSLLDPSVMALSSSGGHVDGTVTRVTDVPVDIDSIPAQLGTTARIAGDDVLVELEPRDALLHHGIVRTSVLAYLVDCAGGIPLDRDPDTWTLTT